MGACASKSDKEERLRSEAIDKQIEEDNKKYKRECKILLLGSGESGKSTIVKQMKIIHQDGFTPEELTSYRPFIYRNVLESAHALILAMRKLDVEPSTYSTRLLAEKVLDFRFDDGPSGPTTASTSAGGATVSGGNAVNAHTGEPIRIPQEIAEAIYNIWQDDAIQPFLDEHSSDFYLMDSGPYFFSEVLRIGAPEYVPTTDDVLRARVKTTGITETRFTMGQLSIHMFDVGGQRSERRKWIHCFESVTSIIFCTAISEYDQVLLEERNQNRMQESLVLFESVINSRWFLRTSIILFLNKIDVFKTKIRRTPLERYFPEYTGGGDVNKAAKYILWRFMQANRARLSVYPHLTQATDTTNIRLVFAAVKETILQNALKDSGIL